MSKLVALLVSALCAVSMNAFAADAPTAAAKPAPEVKPAADAKAK